MMKWLGSRENVRLRRGLWRGLLIFVGSVVIAFSCWRDSDSPTAASRTGSTLQGRLVISPVPFDEMNGSDVYNASDVVPLADSRFLFCDNRAGDALFELDLTPDGKKKGPLIRRPLQGLGVGAINDLEGMTFAEENGQRFVFVTSSLYVKKAKGKNPSTIPSSGLLRVKISSNNQLTADNIPGFRNWFINHAPTIAASATLSPDDRGLNIEGLAWDQSRHALLFGLRTPVAEGKAIIIPVRVKNLAGSWTTDNLEMLPPIKLSLEAAEGEQGIRSIEYIDARKSFLIIVGKTISDSTTPFSLYEWDGKQDGKMRRLNVSFAKKMKPEGITSGTVGSKPVLLFVDDGGGYQVVWLDNTRL